MLGRSSTEAVIGWVMRERKIIFRMMLPNLKPAEFKRTPTRNKARSPQQTHAAWEQARRSRWRALHLCIRTKLKAVEVGVSTLEKELLAHNSNARWPNGRRVRYSERNTHLPARSSTTFIATLRQCVGRQ